MELRVEQFLTSRHVPGLRSLTIQADDGVVTLSGNVFTFYEKQLCNQCLRRVPGIKQLINTVDVTATDHEPSAALDDTVPLNSANYRNSA